MKLKMTMSMNVISTTIRVLSFVKKGVKTPKETKPN